MCTLKDLTYAILLLDLKKKFKETLALFHNRPLKINGHTPWLNELEECKPLARLSHFIDDSFFGVAVQMELWHFQIHFYHLKRRGASVGVVDPRPFCYLDILPDILEAAKPAAIVLASICLSGS